VHSWELYGRYKFYECTQEKGKTDETGTRIDGLIEISELHIAEWSAITRISMWNVVMTREEERRWTKLLPSILLQDQSAVKANFPVGRIRNYKFFIDSVTSIIRRIARDRRHPRIDCPPGIYKRRWDMVKCIEEAKEGDTLTKDEIGEWPAIIVKLRQKTLFTYDEERVWFRRLGVIQLMDEEDLFFKNSDGYEEDLYRSVSSALRKMREWKEKADKEANIDEGKDDAVAEEEEEDVEEIDDEDDDDTTRMGDRPEANLVEPWIASFGKFRSPALDRIPHPRHPPELHRS